MTAPVHPLWHGALVSSLALAWATTFAFSVHAVLPYNPVRLHAGARSVASAILPQGWKFFTRDPREEALRPYRPVAGDSAWTSASEMHHSRPAAAFGLRRDARAQGIEMGLLLYGLPAQMWSGCDDAVETCLTAAPVATTLTNESPAPSLCGTIGFVLQKPVPWAWASPAAVHMPSRVLKVVVKC